MSVLWLSLIVFILGCLGGIVNALNSDNGFMLPKTVVSGEVKIWKPGFLVNLLVGGTAAFISWGLYGPLSSAFILSTSPAEPFPEAQTGLTLAAVAGAILVGMGGARWLTNEVDKKLLQAAASNAANRAAEPQLAAQILRSSPEQAVRITEHH
ncbi:MAG TPA: hypothetical protein VLM80_01400 [Anaerolineales bacterium]|nr:hypothetical protein [Anaerolineales bacterium]